MSGNKSEGLNLQFHALTPKRWPDLEKMFGENGACGGCWCMWWRLSRSQFNKSKGAGNKKALKRIVYSGTIPGILAYSEGQPVGWCAIGPREQYPALERSRILKPVDDKPVWAVVCFFTAKPYRNKGITANLLKAALAFAERQGANTIEGYPTEPRKGKMPDPFLYTGMASTFLKGGFKEVLRRSETRPIMRYTANRSSQTYALHPPRALWRGNRKTFKQFSAARLFLHPHV